MSDEERGILVPEWKQPEPELEFTKQQRSRNIYAKKNPLRVMPQDKSVPAHRSPGTNRSALRVHPGGLEIGVSMGEGVARSAGICGVLFLVFPAIFIYMAAAMGDYLPLMIMGLAGAAGSFLGCMLLIRYGFFSPSDHPVLFIPGTQQVYVIPFQLPSFFKFWEKGEPGKLRSYRWEDVTARTYRRLDVPGGTVARTETTLQMLCATPEKPKLVDLIVSLGFTGTWADNEQVKLWEHIRRYMEEGGPPLQPGDELRKVDHAKLPQFPPEIIAAVGGPALTDAELMTWTQATVA